MSERLFLYIDILGFSELVSNDEAMDEIFTRIDKLNVHTDGSFKTLVFSDTILVYGDGAWLSHKREAVMWLSEFAQDLFYRFIPIDRHFRAYLTVGDFVHQKKEHFEAFYGQALVDCYNKEKEIKSTGLYMDKKLVPYSNIFHTTPYDDDCSYVHIMQDLDNISTKAGKYPIDPAILQGTDIDYFVAPCFVYLRNVWKHSNDDALPESVRLKYSNTWKMVADRHAGLLKVLADNDFDPQAVAPFDWGPAMAMALKPD